MICEGLEESIGAKLDLEKNRQKSNDARTIHDDQNPSVTLFVIPTNEELEIALQTQEVLSKINS